MLRISDFTSLQVVDPPFGLCSKRTAAALRRLADDIEAGRTLLGAKVTITAVAENEEFASQELTLRVHEKQES